ncbi:unnamed protein product [Staurois parvus]|uniref:Uncharacterized protein n=1 Tax=Staurois parvus TaxID=386267 RepID=A0ABN9HGM7_9NEOB|nr:unnamed protein product [Staurois parvus]
MERETHSGIGNEESSELYLPSELGPPVQQERSGPARRPGNRHQPICGSE